MTRHFCFMSTVDIYILFMVLLFLFSLSNYPEDCVNNTISSAALELLFLTMKSP